MSSRAFRRINQQSSQPEPEPVTDASEASEEEENGAPAAFNPFDLLQLQQGESADDEPPVEATSDEEPNDNAPASKQPQKKRKKKSKKRAQESPLQPTEDDFDFDSYVQQAGDAAIDEGQDMQPSSSQNSKKKSVLSVTASDLNSENEIKRLFGTSVLKDSSAQRQNRRLRFPGRHLLCNPSETTWPNMPKSGMSMELLGENSEKGITWFAFTHNAEYIEEEEEFLASMSSMSPDALEQFAQTNPSHTNTLLLLSFIATQMGEVPRANLFLGRALYTLEKSFHLRFSLLTTSTRAQLSYYRYENRALYLALFHHCALLQRAGCWRTALEVSKAICLLDRDSDSLGMWLLSDFLGLRSDCCQWVLDAWNQSRDWLQYYINWAYSAALATFNLESKGQLAAEGQDSFKLLKDAVLWYPWVLPMLVEKAGIPLNSQESALISGEEFSMLLLESHVDETTVKNIRLLTELYVERSFSLWKQPEVIAWLRSHLPNICQSLQQPSADDTSIISKAKASYKIFASLPLAVYRHVYLSDWTSTSTTANAAVNLQKYFPQSLIAGPSSKTPWLTAQMSIIDPFPPLTIPDNAPGVGKSTTPVGPYLTYFKRSILLQYPHQLLPLLLSSPEMSNFTAEQVLEQCGLSTDELPRDLRGIERIGSGGSSWAGLISFVDSMMPWRSTSLGGARGRNSNLDDDVEQIPNLLTFLQARP